MLVHQRQRQVTSSSLQHVGGSGIQASKYLSSAGSKKKLHEQQQRTFSIGTEQESCKAVLTASTGTIRPVHSLAQKLLQKVDNAIEMSNKHWTGIIEAAPQQKSLYYQNATVTATQQHSCQNERIPADKLFVSRVSTKTPHSKHGLRVRRVYQGKDSKITNIANQTINLNTATSLIIPPETLTRVSIESCEGRQFIKCLELYHRVLIQKALHWLKRTRNMQHDEMRCRRSITQCETVALKLLHRLLKRSRCHKLVAARTSNNIRQRGPRPSTVSLLYKILRGELLQRESITAEAEQRNFILREKMNREGIELEERNNQLTSNTMNECTCRSAHSRCSSVQSDIDLEINEEAREWPSIVSDCLHIEFHKEEEISTSCVDDDTSELRKVVTQFSHESQTNEMNTNKDTSSNYIPTNIIRSVDLKDFDNINKEFSDVTEPKTTVDVKPQSKSKVLTDAVTQEGFLLTRLFDVTASRMLSEELHQDRDVVEECEKLDRIEQMKNFFYQKEFLKRKKISYMAAIWSLKAESALAATAIRHQYDNLFLRLAITHELEHNEIVSRTVITSRALLCSGCCDTTFQKAVVRFNCARKSQLPPQVHSLDEEECQSRVSLVQFCLRSYSIIDRFKALYTFQLYNLSAASVFYSSQLESMHTLLLKQYCHVIKKGVCSIVTKTETSARRAVEGQLRKEYSALRSYHARLKLHKDEMKRRGLLEQVQKDSRHVIILAMKETRPDVIYSPAAVMERMQRLEICNDEERGWTNVNNKWHGVYLALRDKERESTGSILGGQFGIIDDDDDDLFLFGRDLTSASPHQSVASLSRPPSVADGEIVNSDGREWWLQYRNVATPPPSRNSIRPGSAPAHRKPESSYQPSASPYEGGTWFTTDYIRSRPSSGTPSKNRPLIPKRPSSAAAVKPRRLKLY